MGLQKVILTFDAIRLKHKICFPKLEKWDGKKLVLEKTFTQYDNKVIGDIAGCCVYRSRGKQVYLIRGGVYIKSTSIPKNPLK